MRFFTILQSQRSKSGLVWSGGRSGQFCLEGVGDILFLMLTHQLQNKLTGEETPKKAKNQD